MKLKTTRAADESKGDISKDRKSYAMAVSARMNYTDQSAHSSEKKCVAQLSGKGEPQEV